MANYTAADVKRLREHTADAAVDCKRGNGTQQTAD